ncbi:Lysine decarboxylase 2, constitutive [Pseudomonas paraeruginosa]|nr:Lysine decarboxylase 2, constitutive [Pseudomonas aeruginosa]
MYRKEFSMAPGNLLSCDNVGEREVALEGGYITFKGTSHPSPPAWPACPVRIFLRITSQDSNAIFIDQRFPKKPPHAQTREETGYCQSPTRTLSRSTYNGYPIRVIHSDEFFPATLAFFSGYLNQHTSPPSPSGPAATPLSDSPEPLSEEREPLAQAFHQALRAAMQRLAGQDGHHWFFQPAVAASHAAEEAPARRRWQDFSRAPGSCCQSLALRVDLGCPGLDAQGRPASFGVPAQVVSRYLRRHGITPLCTGDYRVLLFLPRDAQPEHARPLVDKLLEFKRWHDEDAPLKQVIPDLLESSPLYNYLGLRELCAMIHEASLRLRLAELAAASVGTAIRSAVSPAALYGYLVNGETEWVELADLGGRVVVSLIGAGPADPPLLLPGDRVPLEPRALVDYLLALRTFGEHFPGFEPLLQGVEVDARGRHVVRCVKPAALALRLAP